MIRTRWKYATTATDGYCILFDVNIFDYDWVDTKEKITIKDPLYKQERDISVYYVVINNKVKQFAACEFSNCVWGFYLPSGGRVWRKR